MTITSGGQAVATPLATYNQMLELMWPIGTIIETTGSAPTFGTWQNYGAERMCVSAGSTYAVGAQGGVDTVTLNTTHLPVHTHTFTNIDNHYGATGGNVKSPGMREGNFFTSKYNSPGRRDPSTPVNAQVKIEVNAPHIAMAIENTGGNAAHNNMQPYIVVNRFRRIA